MTHDKQAVRRILDQAKIAKRTALTAPEARSVCEAYGISIPKEGVARSAEEAVKLASGIGFPVVMKIVSPQILHKTEAGGVIVGNAGKYDAKAEILRGAPAWRRVRRAALAGMIETVSALVADFRQISEMDLSPVFATDQGATAADVRIVLDFNPAPEGHRPIRAAVVERMTRIMKPKAVAVMGASSENGMIGNSVMKNLVNGGYRGDIDVAVSAIPAKFVAKALIEVGEKKIAGAGLIPRI